MQTQTAVEPKLTAAAAPTTTFVDRVWPTAVISLAFLLNAAWVALLGYGFARMIGLML